MPAATAVLVDASALVALLDRKDVNHDRCVEVMSSVVDPLVTVMPAVIETMHMMSGLPRAQDTLIDMIAGIHVSGEPRCDGPAAHEVLMNKYRELPMDFADAALVRVAERDKLTRVLTFDSHLSVYPLPGRARFVLLGGGPSLER